MGTYCILIIGDWRAELEPLVDVAHIGDPFSPYIRHVNILDNALRNEYRADQRKVKLRCRVYFSEWLTQTRHVNALVAGETPDLASKHRLGWIRLDNAGEVSEVILRNPGAPILYISGSIDQFLLKTGRRGWDVDPYGAEDLEITQGYASSARLCDIDFTTMQQGQTPTLEYQEVRFRGASIGMPSESELFELLASVDHATCLTSVVVKH